jgi:hypothetical protein
MENLPADDGGTRRPAVLTEPGTGTAARTTVRLAATLLFAGVVVSLAAGVFHADSASANDHPATFAEYARSGIWTGVHLGQFSGMAVLIAGLLVLWSAVDVPHGALAWTARFGAVSAVAALALYGGLQAVDGVALKHAVDAWAAAAGPEKTTRFAAAEAIRWLEWGLRSYQSFLLGAALVLLGIVIAATGRIPRIIGYLMGLSGLAYLVQGWIIGTEGFSAANSVPTLAGIALTVAWTVWLLISAWRMKDGPAPGRGSR